MNLTIAELAELPLTAALVEGDDVVARTPEWRGAAPGSVTYRTRRGRLVVSTEDTDPMCAPVLDSLLDEIDSAARALPRRQALRVAMLGASLRVVAGRTVSARGTSAEVLEHACAGIAMRTALQVSVEHDEDSVVEAPAVAALVLVQLAANAERHEHAQSVLLRAARRVFAVEWSGATAGPGATTARRRAERQGWGLGFARLAADAIGAVVYPPSTSAGGLRGASLEVGLNRLSLPLALLSAGAVRKATRAWDEETGMVPGTRAGGEKVAQCVDAAAAWPGSIARVNGWAARTGRQGTWVAIPPDLVADRARDVLDGMIHERALWDGVPEPGRSRIVALAAILASMLGADLVRVPRESWNRRAPDIARAYGLTIALPQLAGAGAVDPRVALFLASEFGESLESDGDDLYLRIRAESRGHPLVRVFLAPGDDSLKLS